MRVIFAVVMLMGLMGSVAYGAEPTKLAAGEGLHGRFQQLRYLTGFDAPIRSTGSFFLIPGIELVWQTETPFGTRTVLDDKSVTQAIGKQEVTKVSLDRFPGLAVLRDALEDSLSGNWKKLEELAGSKLRREGEQWHLNLTPDAGPNTLPFTAVEFSIGEFLEAVEIVKEKGDRDVITFFEQQTAPTAEIRQLANKKNEMAQ